MVEIKDEFESLTKIILLEDPDLNQILEHAINIDSVVIYTWVKKMMKQKNINKEVWSLDAQKLIMEDKYKLFKYHF